MRRATFIAAVCTAVVAASMAAMADSSAGAARPVLRFGDSGPTVVQWQRQLNRWLTRRGRRLIPVDGTFGHATLGATNELEDAQGLPRNDVVDDRTRAALYDALHGEPVNWEWPVPLPVWWWTWAQWRLGRGPFRGHGRDRAVRPSMAPLPVPSWAFRRLTRLQRVGVEQRARTFVVQRLRNRYRAGEIEVRTTVHSRRDARWVRLSGTYGEPLHRIWAAWLERGGTRWRLRYVAVDEAAVQPLAPVRASIPCDIRPAFASPRC